MNKRNVSARPLWTIQEAISFILFGDPERPLPDRGVGIDEYALAEIIAIPQRQPYARATEVTAHAQIRQEVHELLQAAAQFPELGAICCQIAQNRQTWKARRNEAEAVLANALQKKDITISARRSPKKSLDAPLAKPL